VLLLVQQYDWTVLMQHLAPHFIIQTILPARSHLPDFYIPQVNLCFLVEFPETDRKVFQERLLHTFFRWKGQNSHFGA